MAEWIVEQVRSDLAVARHSRPEKLSATQHIYPIPSYWPSLSAESVSILSFVSDLFCFLVFLCFFSHPALLSLLSSPLLSLFSLFSPQLLERMCLFLQETDCTQAAIACWRRKMIIDQSLFGAHEVPVAQCLRALGELLGVKLSDHSTAQGYVSDALQILQVGRCSYCSYCSYCSDGAS